MPDQQQTLFNLWALWDFAWCSKRVCHPRPISGNGSKLDPDTGVAHLL